MKKFWLLLCVLVGTLTLTITASAFENPHFNPLNDELLPRIYECPASGDGYHHYQKNGTEFVHQRKNTERCITYDGTIYICGDCGDRFVSGSNYITEHEYNGNICRSLGLPD